MKIFPSAEITVSSKLNSNFVNLSTILQELENDPNIIGSKGKGSKIIKPIQNLSDQTSSKADLLKKRN